MNRKSFYDALRADKRVFGQSLSAQQVEGMEGILDAFATHGDGQDKTLAYALATAYHETARRMVPVREGLASTDAGARRAVNNLATKRGPNSAVAKYAKVDPATGHVYYGRGHVQLTWDYNYKASSADAGVDLYKNPDAMLDPIISARVLVRGLIDGRWNGAKKGVGYYLATDDLKNARRTVNITDKWEMIAGYYNAFLQAITQANVAEEKAPLPIEPMPEPNAPTKDEKSSSMKTIAGALATLIAAIIAAVGGDKIDLIKQITEALQ